MDSKPSQEASLDAGVAPVDPARAALELELARLARPVGGVVGVAALHVESGRQVQLNPDVAFPLGSTYKLPLALLILTRVDRGEEQLERRVAIDPRDLRPGGGVSGRYTGVGFTLTVREMLQTLIQESDNTTADLFLRDLGGPEVVTRFLRDLGVPAIRVDRPYTQLVLDLNGVTGLSSEQWTVSRYLQMREAVPAQERLAALNRFEVDPRDTGTPAAMAGLLVRLQKGEMLRPQTTALLLEIMRGTRTGDGRIRALLPPGSVADKTGTVGRSVNDVGLITLPDGLGHVALAVYSKGSDAAETAKERVIAEIARAIHLHFNAPAGGRNATGSAGNSPH